MMGDGLPHLILFDYILFLYKYCDDTYSDASDGNTKDQPVWFNLVLLCSLTVPS